MNFQKKKRAWALFFTNNDTKAIKLRRCSQLPCYHGRSLLG